MFQRRRKQWQVRGLVPLGGAGLRLAWGGERCRCVPICVRALTARALMWPYGPTEYRCGAAAWTRDPSACLAVSCCRDHRTPHLHL